MDTLHHRRLNTPQAAEFLGLAAATLERDRVTGRLGIPYLKLGRRVLYDRSDLEAWLDRRRRAHTSDAGNDLDMNVNELPVRFGNRPHHG